MTKMKKVLAVVAHPDDEVLGCGGVMARLSQQGHEVYSMILGEGLTARDNERVFSKSKSALNELKKNILDANKIINVKEVFTEDFPDNRFDSVDLLDIVKSVEKVCDKVKPDVIFTHYWNDLNIDHQITCKAVITATRPMQEQTVEEIYSFEVPSSTEWNFPLSFSPNVFFDIAGTIDLKLEAMSKYVSELRDFPHPRSLEAIKLNAKNWGVKVGMNYAEAFSLVRSIRKNKEL